MELFRSASSRHQHLHLAHKQIEQEEEDILLPLARLRIETHTQIRRRKRRKHSVNSCCCCNLLLFAVRIFLNIIQAELKPLPDLQSNPLLNEFCTLIYTVCLLLLAGARCSLTLSSTPLNRYRSFA